MLTSAVTVKTAHDLMLNLSKSKPLRFALIQEIVTAIVGTNYDVAFVDEKSVRYWFGDLSELELNHAGDNAEMLAQLYEQIG